jgi:hypothetical protein
METTRLVLTVPRQEKDALRFLAAREYRDYRAQAALIIRDELTRRGLLPAIPNPSNPPGSTGARLEN